MPGVAAHDVDDASTANNLAVLADSLDAGTDFHDYLHFNLSSEVAPLTDDFIPQNLIHLPQLALTDKSEGGKAPQYKR